MSEVRLTQYSHGAGCGCKISPTTLNKILESNNSDIFSKNLIVGNKSKDDAAVYDIGNGKAVISTTDFFMPIVDDPFTFGRIAATNAISDVYAMGGKPLFAIAILGWPIDKLEPEVAKEVLEGGRKACKDAGIVIAGGHSIDSPEPIFGLAVTGEVEIEKLKRNDTATKGCKLYLTKPLGVGILTTAEKRGILKAEHSSLAPNSMMTLNSIGEKLSNEASVRAMTDVTGFGLLGHLTEMCEGSSLTAIIDYSKVPKFDILNEYIAQKSMPGGTFTNWKSYRDKIELANDDYKFILCDPQTSGGLLIAVEDDHADKIEKIINDDGLIVESFGRLVEKQEKLIIVE